MEFRIKERFPTYERKVKEDSAFMRFLGKVSFFNKRFLSGYITTMGNTIYVPRDRNTPGIWRVVAHEWIHLEQNKRQGFMHGVLYMVPQVLAFLSLLSILAIWLSNWWLLCLLFLLCLAPIPAPWRMSKEFEAYTMSMAVSHWERTDTDYYLQNIAKNFYGPSYYFMWPFKDSITAKLKEELEKVRLGEYDNKAVFKDVKDIMGGV
jgi:hypothetical protein